MEFKPDNGHHFYEMLASFGALGGLIRFLHFALHDRRKSTLRLLILQIIMSGCLGLIFGSGARAMEFNADLVLFIAGTSGALGWESIVLFFDFLKLRLQADIK